MRVRHASHVTEYSVKAKLILITCILAGRCISVGIITKLGAINTLYVVDYFKFKAKQHNSVIYNLI